MHRLCGLCPMGRSRALFALTLFAALAIAALSQFCPRVVEQLAALYPEDPEALAMDEEFAGAA